MPSSHYPSSPSQVPQDLTTPNKSYKKHVWIASAALLLFFAFYLGLSFWFLYKSYKSFANLFTGHSEGFLSFLAALGLGFLGVFMIKALFFRNKRDSSEDMEITPEQEPLLFEFIYQVADEAKAPRPHKVFLSNRVNAAVFYDVSILNLLIPTRKNLEIGLGLVNTLDLAEFKAILAHEFGHFGQKSMLVGRWVYIVNQIAYRVIAKRDAFDRMLTGLSGLDLRIAWVGWILSIIVWSLRAVSQVFFKLVLFTQRALSREMEFHADLVAVSLTGSDAIVHSLHKLGAADDAYDEAIEFANKQLKHNRAISDVFALQSNSIKHTAQILNNPAYGHTPVPPQGNGAAFTVFKEQLAQPPKMWSTHPSNLDREKNAKKRYIQSATDERSPWLLFKDPEATRLKMTRQLYTTVKVPTTLLSVEESLNLHTQQFERSFQAPRYRGIYLKRPIFTNVPALKDVYDMDIDPGTVSQRFAELYPESLQLQLEHLRNLEEELVLLEGLHKKELDANNGKINYRGRELDRKELPEVIEQTRKEEQEARRVLGMHDKLSRNMHAAAARKIGKGWDNYLQSVAGLLHFCEHAEKVIEVRSRYFYDTLAVASRIRRINAEDLKPLLNAGNSLQKVLLSTHNNYRSLELNTRLVEKLGGKPLHETTEEFKLNEVNDANVNAWIEVLPGWIGLVNENLHLLREAALDELLQTEATIEAAVRTSEAPIDYAPAPLRIPETYPVYDASKKLEVTQKPGLLSNFYYSQALWPTLGRLAVAGLIIFAAVFFTSGIGKLKLYIYNGLPVDVTVNVSGRNLVVEHNGLQSLELADEGKQHITTTTLDGQAIESFEADAPGDNEACIYNVANAAVMYKWTAYYSAIGNIPASNYQMIGAPRWFGADADHYLEEPPQTLSVKQGETASLDVITAMNEHPGQMVNAIPDSIEQRLYLTAHALWEPSDSPNAMSWLGMAASVKVLPQIIDKRLARDPLDVLSLRMQQEAYTGAEKEKVCAQQNALYQQHPDNPNLYYLRTRCLPDGLAQDSAFVQGRRKWSDNPWLAYAASYVYAQHENWDEVIACYQTIQKQPSPLREAIYEDMDRTTRLLHKENLMEGFGDFRQPYVIYLNDINNSRSGSNENQLYAFKLLAEGKLQDALDYSAADSNLYNHILGLAAVSDGADEAIATKALARPVSALTGSLLFPSIALTVKYHGNLAAYTPLLEAAMTKENADSVRRFIDLVRDNKLAEADKLLYSVGAALKGKMALLGMLVQGKRAPERWNLLASRLLFIYEKPYRMAELKD